MSEPIDKVLFETTFARVLRLLESSPSLVGRLDLRADFARAVSALAATRALTADPQPPALFLQELHEWRHVAPCGRVRMPVGLLRLAFEVITGRQL